MPRGEILYAPAPHYAVEPTIMHRAGRPKLAIMKDYWIQDDDLLFWNGRGGFKIKQIAQRPRQNILSILSGHVR